MKLPKDILFAVATYYANRGLQYVNHYTSIGGEVIKTWTVSKRKWDKESDLTAIGKACSKHNISFSAASGTFWFCFRNRKATYRMDETSFPHLVKNK